MPEIAIAPASELIVELSDASTLSLLPALIVCEAPMLEIFAMTLLRTQFNATEPAPAIVPEPAPLTAIAAICTSRPIGSELGLANVASTKRLPVCASTEALSIIAVTLS